MVNLKTITTIGQLGRLEMRHLPGLLLRNRAKVEQQLRLGFQKDIYYMSTEDEKRLLTLKYWAEKYKVSIGYILKVLLPYYQSRFPARRKVDEKRRRGLPVRIATLTGQASEWVLKQKIEKDFPDRENYEIWRQEKKKQILQSREDRKNGSDDDLQPRRKTILDYEFPGRYVRSYKKQMRQKQKALAREIAKPENKKFNYRNSPWA